MKIILAGGSGQVGQILARAFVARGHEVIILSRQAGPSASYCTVQWDARSLGPWTQELEGADAVINLAGRSVNCRYDEAHRQEIMQSRLESTRVLGEAIRAARQPPRAWLQSSTATIYAHRFDAPNDENHGILGGAELNLPDTWRFSLAVATAWEQTALAFAPLPSTRLVLLRSSIIMSPDAGGAFSILLRLVRWGLGGRAGQDSQYISWIHEADFVEAIHFILEHKELEGVFNLAAPEPLPNSDFMRALRAAWGIRLGLPATRWMLEIGAFFLRTETKLVLKSRRVMPGRLLAHGFAFRYPHWAEAARELCARSRA